MQPKTLPVPFLQQNDSVVWHLNEKSESNDIWNQRANKHQMWKLKRKKKTNIFWIHLILLMCLFINDWVCYRLQWKTSSKFNGSWNKMDGVFNWISSDISRVHLIKSTKKSTKAKFIL